MDLSPTEPTSTPEPKPTRAQKGEIIGTGIIVTKRNRKGRMVCAGHPFEHADKDSAIAEASKLAKKYPGETFMVMIAVAMIIEDSSGSLSGEL